ncbi:MAG: tRNA (adenine-N1)-methyltransferase [Desulfovibrionaceae bacterium]
MIASGEVVLLVSPKGKRYLHVLDSDKDIHTHDGRMRCADIQAAGYGAWVHTHLGRPYRILRPTVHDLIKGVKRQTQIMYPKEIGYVLLKLGVRPGSRVVECGTGSGGLTLALASFVGDTGKVYTFERREEFAENARRNLERVGLSGRVEQAVLDLSEQGFPVSGADALFLDVRTPWEYLHHIPPAVIPGAVCGFLLPTVNQVSDLIRGLEAGPFGEIEVMEILVRHYKPVADRLRPVDRMVAHTGFLIFARCMDDAPPPPAPDAEAREPKEHAPGDAAAEAARRADAGEEADGDVEVDADVDADVDAEGQEIDPDVPETDDPDADDAL